MRRACLVAPVVSLPSICLKLAPFAAPICAPRQERIETPWRQRVAARGQESPILQLVLETGLRSLGDRENHLENGGCEEATLRQTDRLTDRQKASWLK